MQADSIQRRIEQLPAPSRPAGGQAERRAVCVERRTHGSEGGVGSSSREAVRAYPTETRFSGSGSAASKARPRPSRGRTGQECSRGRDRHLPEPGRFFGAGQGA